MKIAFICPGFSQFKVNKQPWKYVHELAKYSNKYHEVLIITDTSKLQVDDIETIFVNQIFKPLKGESKELLNVIELEKPDICVMLLGLTSFLRMEFKIKIPVIGIFTSPLYSFRELIRNVGIQYSIKNWKCVDVQYINSLIPNFFVRKWADKFRCIVFLSEYTQRKLVEKGLHEEKTFFLPSGVDLEFLTMPDKKNVENIKNKINPDNIPLILYFTSPLTLRGTDILVKAFCDFRGKTKSKLVLLSRMDKDIYRKEENLLRDIADTYNCNDSIEIISKNLKPNEIKNYLSAADLICLPFKIVISDIPVSLLESMAIGKPVISTKVACIPEIINNENLIVDPNNDKQLSQKLLDLFSNMHLIKEYGIKSKKNMDKHPSWNEIGQVFLEEILKEI